MLQVNIHANLSPYLVFFNNDDSVSLIGDCNSYGLSIEKMKGILEYAKQYIKQYKTSDGVQAANDAEEARRIRDAENSPRPTIVTAPKKCFVYLVYDEDRNLFKIGRAMNIQNRIAQIKTANAGVTLHSHFEAVNSDERHLHDFFSHKRVSGEWFKLEPHDIDYVNHYFSVTEIPL